MDGKVFDKSQLLSIVDQTVGHYESRAAQFWEGTRDHDVSQNVQTLLSHLCGAAQMKILDFGCGPGRDLATFKALGHDPVGLDGSESFCAMARAHSGCEVLHQDFLCLDLPAESFDGVFANATLFHVPTQELPRVLSELRSSLKSRGVLFSSNPRGQNVEGFDGQRFGAYHDLEAWRGFMVTCGFEELSHYYRPRGRPRHEQPWLASAWRKL